MKKFNELQIGDAIYTAYYDEGRLIFSRHQITGVVDHKRGSVEVTTFQSNRKYTANGGTECEYFDADVRMKDMDKSFAWNGDYWKDRMHYTDASLKDEVSECLLKEAVKFTEDEIAEKQREIGELEEYKANYNALLAKLEKIQ